MAKWIIIMFMVLMMGYAVTAMDMCESSMEITGNCTMITPTLNCTTYIYDLINMTGENGQVIIDDGTLYNVNGNVYKFNFTEPQGQYLAVLCDGSTREIHVTTKGDTVYIALSIILSVVIFSLFILSRNIEFLTVSTKKGVELPLGTYMIYLLAGWMMLALINVGIKIVEVNNIGLVNTMNGVFKASLYIMLTLTAVWLAIFLYYLTMSIVEYSDMVK